MELITISLTREQLKLLTDYAYVAAEDRLEWVHGGESENEDEDIAECNAVFELVGELCTQAEGAGNA